MVAMMLFFSCLKLFTFTSPLSLHCALNHRNIQKHNHRGHASKRACWQASGQERLLHHREKVGLLKNIGITGIFAVFLKKKGTYEMLGLKPLKSRHLCLQKVFGLGSWESHTSWAWCAKDIQEKLQSSDSTCWAQFKWKIGRTCCCWGALFL